MHLLTSCSLSLHAVTRKQQKIYTLNGYYSRTKKEQTTATSYSGYATSYQITVGSKGQLALYDSFSTDLTYRTRVDTLSKSMLMPIKKVSTNGAINVSMEQESTDRIGSNISSNNLISWKYRRAHGI